MSKTVYRPKKIKIETQYNEAYSMVDVFLLLGSSGVGFITKGIVFSWLQFVYVAFLPISLFFLLAPSGIVGKKNYQVALQVIMKDRKVYHPIKKSKGI